MKYKMRLLLHTALFVLVFCVSQILIQLSFYFYHFIQGHSVENIQSLTRVYNHNSQYFNIIGMLIFILALYLGHKRKHATILHDIDQCKFDALKTILVIAICFSMGNVITYFFRLLPFVKIGQQYISFSNVFAIRAVFIETLLKFAVICLIIPMLEEILFRGILFRYLKTNSGLTFSIVVQALAFALIHGQLYRVIYAFFLGLVFCSIYLWCKSIWASVLAHIVYNTTVNLLRSITLVKFYNTWGFYIMLASVILFILCLRKLKDVADKNKHYLPSHTFTH